MNIFGRLAYYFSYFWAWLVDCWKWLTTLLNENILLKEIIKVLGIGIITLLFIYLISKVLNAING